MLRFIFAGSRSTPLLAEAGMRSQSRRRRTISIGSHEAKFKSCLPAPSLSALSFGQNRGRTGFDTAFAAFAAGTMLRQQEK
jgi:hypothetical protein